MTARVLFAGAWEVGPAYPRAESLLAAARGAGLEVTEVRVPDAGDLGESKRALVARPWRWPGYVLRQRRRRRALQAMLRRSIESVRPDVVVVPYPGHVVVPAVRSVWSGPLVLDLFLSAFDTAVVDRGMFAPRSLPARVLRRLDRRACDVADRILLDTPEHAARVAELLDLPRARFDWVPVGTTRAPIAAELPESRPRRPGDPLDVLFFGTGVPLHGLEVLVRAIATAGPAVRLTLVGGTDAERELATRTLGDRLTLGDRFEPPPRLAERLARADVVAGVFGTSPKADCVVPFKVMHALAHGRPVVTGHASAVAARLAVDIECVTVPLGAVEALSARLRSLVDEPDVLNRVARAARPAFDREFSIDALGLRLVAALEPLLSARPSSSVPGSVDVARQRSAHELAEVRT